MYFVKLISTTKIVQKYEHLFHNYVVIQDSEYIHPVPKK